MASPNTGGVSIGRQDWSGTKVFQQHAANDLGVMTGDITLYALTSAQTQIGDAGSGNRNVALPSPTDNTGLEYWILNKGTSNNLVVKSGVSTIATIQPGQVGYFSSTLNGSSVPEWIGIAFTGASISGTLKADGSVVGATGQIQVFTDGVQADTFTGNTATTMAIASATASAAVGNPITITASAGNGNTNAGGAITLTTGAGVTSGAGGAFAIVGGAGGTTGQGANIAATAGAGGTTSGAAGTMILTAGAGGAGSTTTGGAAQLVAGGSGTGATGNGGTATVLGGAALSTNGTGGGVAITGGVATGTGTGGAITITSGASGGASGTAGNVAIDCGSKAGGTAGVISIGGTNAGAVYLARGPLKSVIFGQTITSIGTAQNSTPTAAQLLGGVVTQTGATGAGTVTTPTGTVLSAAMPAAVATGDSFECLFCNLGGSQNLVITAGASGMTVVGNATVPSGKNALLTFVNTGATAWNCYVTVSA